MKYLSHLRQQFSLWFLVLVIVTIPVIVFGDEGCVGFDVPATVASCDVSTEESLANNHRLVEIVFPVTTLVGCRSDQRVLEMMIQVRGLGAGLQVVDYGPRTQLYSDIEGAIAVEKRQDRNSQIGINASGNAAEIVNLDAKANIGSSRGSTRRYQQIPAQKLLLASGTVSRGSGAYFKFRHSPQTTLEGGHEIALTLRVPEHWRGGMLRVDCVATGKEKNLWSETDFRAGHGSFVIATWLQGDFDAQKVVQRYSQLESRIRSWSRTRQPQPSNRRSQGLLAGWASGNDTAEVSDDWVERFALLDSRSIEGKLKPRLPKELQQTADQFLASRRGVLQLAR